MSLETLTRENYPANINEGFELYEDLIDFGGLDHEAALETVGYATVATTWDRTDIVDMLATYSVISNYSTFPQGIDKSNENMDAYTRGGRLAMLDAKRGDHV